MPPRNPNFIVPTRPAATSDNSAASTAFVTGATGTLALGTSLQLITRGTVTNAATLNLDVTLAAVGAFHAFHLVLSEWLPATDGEHLWVRFGDSGGINSGASDYSWIIILEDSIDGSTAVDRDDTSDNITIAEDVANDSDAGMSGTYWFNGNGALPQKNFVWGQGLINNVNSTATSFLLSRAGGARVTPIVLTTIQLLFRSGNITTGYYVLYGMSMV